MSVTYTADGTQTVFTFPFDYLRKAFVKVEQNGVLLEQGTLFSVVDKQVVFTTAPAENAIIHIYRQTDTTPLVSWADASILKAKDLTVQQVQFLHILEECQDWFDGDFSYIEEIKEVVLDAADRAREAADEAYRITPEALRWMENFVVVDGRFYQVRSE